MKQSEMTTESKTNNIDYSDDDSDDDVPMLMIVDELKSSSNERARKHINIEKSNNQTNQKKVPVTILTGFLGSGKTTLIQYILHSPHHHYKIAIIENEFAGIDSSDPNNNDAERNSLAIESLIARDGTSFSKNGTDAAENCNLISLTELPNGCVCCTVKDSLVSTLESLIQYKANELDYIIIEASGMANPGPIASIFWLDEQLDSRLRLDGIVTMVDAKNIEMQLYETGTKSSNNTKDHHSDTMTSGFEAERQIAYADRILVNKIDLLQNQTDIDHVLQIVSKINPTAPIKSTIRSKVPDLKWILNANCLDIERVQNVLLEEERMNNEITQNPSISISSNHDSDDEHHDCFSTNSCESNCDHDHSHHHHSHEKHTHSHTSSVQTITLVYSNRSVNLKRMHTWLATILWPNQDRSDEELRWLIGDQIQTQGEQIKTTDKPSAKHSDSNSKTMTIFRMKGILSVCHANLDELRQNDTLGDDEWQYIDEGSGLDARRYILQAVHDLWEIHSGSMNLCWNGSDAEERGCKLVLIGQWIDKQSIVDAFEKCLV